MTGLSEDSAVVIGAAGGSAASSTTVVQEGFVWVMSRTDQPGMIRLGSSLEQPDTINNSTTDAGWTLDYYARVDDRQQAHAAASEFLAPFRRDRHLYETDAVVAATAIENSKVPIRFRKTSFKNIQNSSDQDYRSHQFSSTDSIQDVTETRSVRQRAMAKLLFDAEQLLEDSELVTGPVAYERTFRPLSEQNVAESPLATAAKQSAEPEPTPATNPADALNHRSPMNELLSTEGVRKTSGSMPASRSTPPAPPTPPRSQPKSATDQHEQQHEQQHAQHDQKDVVKLSQGAAKPRREEIPEYPRTDEVLWMNTRKRAPVEQVVHEDNVEVRLEVPHAEQTEHSEESLAADNRQQRRYRVDNDRSILLQMEHLIIKREARQNLRDIRGRIGWSTLKGIPLGALAGFLLMLALNVPDDTAFLIGYLLVGAVLGACLLGLYQSSRLWHAAAHWRRIARHPAS